MSSTSAILTSPPAALLVGEESKNFSFLVTLPSPYPDAMRCLKGVGGCPGEVCRTHVNLKEMQHDYGNSWLREVPEIMFLNAEERRVKRKGTQRLTSFYS
ncbi:hypothetical protein NSTC731_06726 [Nostoc sp. DSM 114167]